MIKFPDALDAATANSSHPLLGPELNRVDGPAKVTGSAAYAAEYRAEGLLYGVIVSSPIAHGRITELDAGPALALPGVVKVFSHLNRPSLAWFDSGWKDDDAPHGSPFRPLYDNKISHSQQPIALVVAETFEQARHGASVLKVSFKTEPHETDLRANLGRAREPQKGKGGYEPPPKPRGDADAALASAPVRISAEYETPAEHHNPMEMFATTVVYGTGGKLTVYDKTQGVVNVQSYLHKVFGLATSDLVVRTPYMGGGFGSGLRPQHQLFLAALAATELKRSVQVGMSRQQMFSFGHRPHTIQRISMGAEADGTLTSIVHECDYENSRFEDHAETVVNWSAMLYQCDNVRLAYRTVPLDVYTPMSMRAPGATPGVYALECAVDEMAHALSMDPLAFRIKNYAERDQSKDLPYSSKELHACFAQGAARFGWSRRNPVPGSMRDGHLRIGWGMACGIWDSKQQKASAKVALHADGSLVVTSAATDIGTGTYTVLMQIGADALGISPERVVVRLGDTDLPPAPLQGGSLTAGSVGTAVKGACDDVAAALLKLAKRAPALSASPLAYATREAVTFANGYLFLRDQPAQRILLTDLMQGAGQHVVEATVTALPNMLKQRKYTVSTHSAVFVEVAVDDLLGKVEVRRVVSAIAGGRILNVKTARSQIVGSVVWGIGMALEEESVMDHRFGRYMNHSYAEYHIPVNADVPPGVDVIFVDEHDDVVNPLGAKGLGEIGIVGVAAAIANAVFHATGRRVRDLPITLDKVMAPGPAA